MGDIFIFSVISKLIIRGYRYLQNKKFQKLIYFTKDKLAFKNN